MKRHHNDILLSILIGPAIGAALTGLSSLVMAASTFRSGNTKQEALAEIDKARQEAKDSSRAPNVAIDAFAKACKAVVRLMPENKDKIRQISERVFGQYAKMKKLPREDSSSFVDRIVHDAMYRRAKIAKYAMQGVTRRDSIGSYRFVIDSYALHNIRQLMRPIRGLNSIQTAKLNRRIDCAILRCMDRAIYSRRMRRDFLATVVMMAISHLLMPLLVKIISAPVVKVLEAPGNALQASIKTNLTDPVTAKIKGMAESVIAKLKQIMANKDKDQSAISALWQGVKPELIKLIDTLRREGGNLGRSILGVLKSGVDKVSQIFSRKDRMPSMLY